MGDEMIVFVSKDGETTSINNPGFLQLYRKKNRGWQVEKEEAFTLSPDRSICEVRRCIAQLLLFMEDCRIFVAGAVGGLPCYELERAGCSVWEYSGKPLDFLDELLGREEEAAARLTGDSTQWPAPETEDLGGGFYRISIKAIQEQEGATYAKNILLPVILKGEYYQLEVLCSDVPLWLEEEAMAGEIIYHKEILGPGEIKLSIVGRLLPTYEDNKGDKGPA